MSRPRVNSAIARATTPVFFIKAGRVLASFNLGCEQQTGWAADEVTGTICEFTSDAAPGTPQALANSLCPPPEVWTGKAAEVPAYLAAKEGKPHAARIRFVPLPDEEGEVRFVMGIIGPFQSQTKSEAASTRGLHAELSALRMTQRRRYGLSSFLGSAPLMTRVLTQLSAARQINTPVHFVGETGTGKEHAARLLHADSIAQSDKTGERRAFVPFDCAGAARWELKQSLKRLFELPGEDSPTAASLRPRTVYLANIDQLPHDLQQQLVDGFANEDGPGWRLITSSTAALDESDDALLPELLYLATTFVIRLPNLRERREDVPLLAQAFLERGNPWEEVEGFAEPVIEAFCDYNWPGNLDELAAVVAEARVTCLAGNNEETGNTIEVAHLPFRFRSGADAQTVSPPDRQSPLEPIEQLLERTEREQIEEALRRTAGNISAAAELLGLNRPKLYRRMESLGIGSESG